MLTNNKHLTEQRMIKCIDTFKDNINKINSGKANPKILDNIKIKYFGKISSIKTLGTIVLENASTLKINLFDSSLIKIVEKEIISSNLGIYPRSVGCIIYVTIPPMSEERRKEFIKIVKNELEQSKISIRNIRRDCNDKLKNLTKSKKISLDEERRMQNEIQKTTDSYIKKLEKLSHSKILELKKI